ncbi:MAG: hypothetical protein IKI21_10725 [Oscillospiraceae bacterium]|nr:hypothetical protein [Oscillospiraceae bacterium]
MAARDDADEAEARNAVFEDAWTYWDGGGIDAILAQMRKDLMTMDETA